MIASGNKKFAPALMDMIIRLKSCCEAREDEIRVQAGLSAAEYSCLRAMPPDVAVHGGELAERMALSPSRASRVIDRLVQRDLLQRCTDAHDRRSIQLTLSGAGKRIKSEIQTCLNACESTLQAGLTDHERSLAGEALTILLREMGSP